MSAIWTAIAFIVLIVLLLFGVPVAFSFGAGAILMLIFLHIDPAFTIGAIFYRIDSFILMAIPFFILAGGLMSEGGISERLVNLAESIVGRVKGGMGIATVLACAFFGSVSGSSAATVASIGSILIPRMTDLGYPKRYTTALVACSGLLGQLIPPSLPMVVYGMLTGTSIAALFLAIVVPAFIIIILYSVVNYFYCRKIPSIHVPAKLPFVTTVKHIGRATYSSSFALLMPIIILGGIYGGFFTPTEAACIAVVYAIPVGFFIYRGLTWNKFFTQLKDAASITGAIVVILFFIFLVSRIFTLNRVPDIIASGLLSVSDNRIIILIFVNLFLIILDIFTDDLSGMLLAVPLLWPIMTQIGIHPVHLAVIMAVNQGSGQMTPPIATNLFVASRISRLPVMDFVRPVIPFLLFGSLPTLILVTYVPEISLWLPQVVLGHL